MTELYKIITDRQDNEVTMKFNVIPTTAIRGNIHKIRQDYVKYDLGKVSSSNRVATVWNSLPHSG